MQLNIYDTLQRRVVPVIPERAGEVRMYTCGPTVYRPVHLGNLRSYLLADWLRRTLEHFGNTVIAVKNITDVGHMRQEAVERGEDKVIAAALAEGKTPKLRTNTRAKAMARPGAIRGNITLEKTIHGPAPRVLAEFSMLGSIPEM